MILPNLVRYFCKLARAGIVILGIVAVPPAIAETASSQAAPATKTTRNIEIAPDDPKSDLVELPRYIVTDSRILPPPESWRYATLPGFEILSNARDTTTRNFLKDFQQLQIATSIVWPTLINGKSSTPTIIILCARGDSFRQFLPDDEGSGIFITPTSLFVEDKERGAIVIDFALQEIFGDTEFANLIDASANMHGEIAEDTDVETSVSSISISDPYGEFYRQYSRFLMRRANDNKPIPLWLEEGLSRLFTTLDFRKKWIEFGKVEYGFGAGDATPTMSSEVSSLSVGDEAAGAKAQDVTGDRGSGRYTDKDRRTLFGHIMPFNAMLDPESANSSDSRWRVQWSKQCFAFVHMCLYGTNKKYQKAFLNFAKRACTGPVDENDFKQCFNKSYKQMASLLAGHVDSLSQQTVRFEAKKGTEGLPDPLPVVLREATQAEIGRIKGEVLRLAGHNDASREALIVPYLRKERDAGLLASLGLLESLENHNDRARKFLETAAKENVVRPRAYVELARLRLDEALAAPAGNNGRLSPAQTASVLEPLFKAREQPPPMEDVYSLIGSTWLCSEVAPKEAHLGVLLEGTLRFPKNINILEHAATLYAFHGDKATAATLANLGVRIAPNQHMREKFETLRSISE